MDGHYKVLEWLIENNKTEVELTYNTNLSTLTYKNYNVFDLWKNFNQVYLWPSVDGYKEHCEYGRTNFGWENFENNLLEVKQYVSTVSCCCSVYSIMTSPDLLVYLNKLNIKTYLSCLSHPEFQDMRLLPGFIKEKITKKFELVKEKHDYITTVDVARGVGNDYSAFIVFDVTQFPYKVVGKYRNNEVKPMLFPNVIFDVAKAYNNAYLLVEVNDIGDQVASILQFDLEYENLLMASMRGRAGQIVGQGFSGKKTQLGVRTTAAVKKLGCSNLKTMIEDNKLLTCDYEIISELTTFAQKHNSFEAEEGCNDDLAMCLVIFAWLVAQDYFKEMTDNDIRKRLYEEQRNQIEQDMAPFGFINDGLDETVTVDSNGDRWYADEYGDRSYMWDYQ